MFLKFNKIDDKLVVTLVGELDHHSAEEVRVKIDDRIERDNIKKVIMDFKEVTFMDSSGIGVVIGRLKKVKNRDGKVCITNINKRVDKLNDDDIIAIIAKQIKTRKESIVEFERGNRQDLIDKTNSEIEILSAYMPEQISEEELSNIIEQAIKKVNATTIKDMGSVMKIVSSKVKGRADMQQVSSIIKSKLN